MPDDGLYCPGSELLAFCVFLVSGVCLSGLARNGNFHAPYLGFPFSATVVDEFFWKLLPARFHLLQEGLDGVSVIGRLQKCLNAENDFLPFIGSGYQAYLVPKLVLFVGLSFGDAPGERLVEAVNLVGVVSFL